MKPASRTLLSLVPLGLQFVAMMSALSVMSFFQAPLVDFLTKHEGQFVVPAPTRLLVENSGASKVVVLGLFAVSLITFAISRSKMKEEADRIAVQSAVYGVVWYLGLVFVGGVLMASALPYFALNQP